MEQSQLVTERGLSSVQPRQEYQRLRMVSPCARHDRCDLEGGLNRAQHAASYTAERHRQFETLDSPGFF